MFGLEQQLTTGMRAVGAEVAQLGYVDELVVDHRWPAHLPVGQHAAGFGRSVAVDEVHVEERLDPLLQFG